MSIISEIITFPSQLAIIDYINSHPLQTTGALDTAVVKSRAPDGIQKVATYFANKQMPFNEIQQHVKEVLTDHDEEKKLADLITDLQGYTTECVKTDNNQPSPFTQEMEHILFNAQRAAKDPIFDTVVVLYETILHDLLDKATFTPPKDGSATWTRHVEDLTTKKELPSGNDLNKNYV